MSQRRTVESSRGVSVILADSGLGSRNVTVVAIPGWKGSDLGLRGLLRPIVQSGYRVVVVNLPGNGVTRAIQDERSDLPQLSQMVRGLLDKVEPDGPLVLVGHSFGATVATEVASRRRDVAGLVLVSPLVVAPTAQRGLAGLLARLVVRLAVWLLDGAPHPVSTAIVRSGLIAAITNGLYAVRGPSGIRRILKFSAIERAIAADPRTMGQQLRVASDYACSEFAVGVSCSVAIVAGDRDQMSSITELKALAKQFQRSTLMILRGGGHLAHHEDREACSQLLLDGLGWVLRE